MRPWRLRDRVENPFREPLSDERPCRTPDRRQAVTLGVPSDSRPQKRSAVLLAATPGMLNTYQRLVK